MTVIDRNEWETIVRSTFVLGGKKWKIDWAKDYNPIYNEYKEDAYEL